MRILSRLGIDVTPTVGSVQLGSGSKPGSLVLADDTTLYRNGAGIGRIAQLDQDHLPVLTATQKQAPSITLTTSATSSTIPLLSWTLPYFGTLTVQATVIVQYQAAGVNYFQCSIVGSTAPTFASDGFYRTEGTANAYGSSTIPLLAEWDGVGPGAITLYISGQNGTGAAAVLVWKTAAIARLSRIAIS